MNEVIKENSEALPTPGIEVLRAIVERHDTMQRAVSDYRQLINAVFYLRNFIPGNQTMGAMEIVEYAKQALREIAESELRNELIKIPTNPKLEHLRKDETED